jgi:phosphopantetheinyl transferase (holo-ACP synthase)
LKKNSALVIGNDIVCLAKAAAESNWRRKGYLEKICSNAEQQLILQDKKPSLMLWLIWTMKESAYKIINRETGIRSFEPLSLNCSIVQINVHSAAGMIKYQGRNMVSRSSISTHYVHSIASETELQLNAIKLTYAEFRAGYHDHFNRSQLSYQLSKHPNGLPRLQHRQTGKFHPVSISHHGPLLAIAYSDFPL